MRNALSNIADRGGAVSRARGVGPLIDIGLALVTGFGTLLLFLWRSEWSELDLRRPYAYFADFLTYGNAVFNAQQGDPFVSATIGGPDGQQLGLSSYGVEWFPAWFVAQLASPADGPWLATFRYWQVSYVAVGITTMLALRWLGVARLPAVLATAAFALLPQHQFNFGSLFYVNYAAVPLMLVVAMRLASGARFADLAPIAQRFSSRSRTRIGIGLVLSCLLLSLAGANYYMIFALFLLASATFFLLLRRRWWPRAFRMGLATAFAVIPLLVSYLPVLISRSEARLGPEDSQADRRAFAAYANGGDPFSLVAPFPSGMVAEWLNGITAFRRFFVEYGSTPVTTGSEYVFYRGGTAVLGALLIVAIGLLGGFRRVDLLGRSSALTSLHKGSILVLGLAVLWYSRGGFGTITGFVLPQVRGYARAALLVSFASLAVLAVVASQRRHVPIAIRVVALVLLGLAAAESVSANVPLVQVSASRVIPVDSGLRTQAGFGIELRSLSPLGTERLVAAASQRLASGCSVLVLPLAKYPVDFSLGVTSYFAYDVLKPGLTPSDLHWTGGGIAGTPNNNFSDMWLEPYARGDVKDLLDAADGRGYCATVLFASMHQVFYDAGRPDVVMSSPGSDGFSTSSQPTDISRYTQPVATVQQELEQRYGAPCYTDEAAQVQLFCR